MDDSIFLLPFAGIIQFRFEGVSHPTCSVRTPSFITSLSPLKEEEYFACLYDNQYFIVDLPLPDSATLFAWAPDAAYR